MTVLLGVILAIVLVGVAYMTLASMLATFRALGGPRLVTCPDSGGLTQVELDARRGAITSALGSAQLRVKECTQWPRLAGCAQACIAGIDLADAKDHGLLIRPFRKARAGGGAVS